MNETIGEPAPVTLPTQQGSLFSRIIPSSFGRRIAGGVLWSVSGAVFSRILVLGASVVLFRMLGKEDFGRFNMVQSSMVMFGAFSGWLGLTATKFVAQYKLSDKDRAGHIITFCVRTAFAGGVIVCLLILLLAPRLASFTLAAPELFGALRIACPYILFSALSATLLGALAGFEVFHIVAAINLLDSGCMFVCVAAGVYWKGFEGAIIALPLSSAVTFIAAYTALRRRLKLQGIRMSLPDWKTHLPILYRFTLPGMVSTLMQNPVQLACAAFLAHRPGGYAQLGIFYAANQWLSAPAFLPLVVGQAILPAMSERLAARDTVKVRKIFWSGTALNAVLSGSIAAVLIIGRKAILTLYGARYDEMALPLLISSLTGVLVAILGPSNSLVVASGRQSFTLLLCFVWGAACLIASYLLVDHGATGLALGRMLAFALNMVVGILGALWIIRNCAVRGAAS